MIDNTGRLRNALKRSEATSDKVEVLAAIDTPLQADDVRIPATVIASEANATTNKNTIVAAIPAAPDNAGISAIGVSISALGSPVQSGDARFDNLDAKISTRSTLTAQGVWEYATRTVTGFGTLVSDIWSAAVRTITDKTGFSLASTERVKLAATQSDYAPARAGDAMTLTGAYDAAKTAASEANASSNKNAVISAMPAAPDNTGIAELNARVPAAPATEGNVTAVGVAVATRASQTSVNAIPTTPLLAADYTAPDNAAIADLQAKIGSVTYGLAALKTLLDNIDTSTELQARFDEIKGEGWTVETLKNVKDAVETLVSSYASAFGEFTPGFLKGYATVVDDSPQRIPRGDATAFTFTLPSGWDLTNRIVYFTAKEDLDSDNDTAIFSRACTVISARVCSITLTSAETGKVGNYQAELRSFAADGSDPKTAQRFPLEIYQDVRTV